MIDGRDPPAEMLERCRLDDMPVPQGERRSHRAAGSEIGRAVAEVQRSARHEANCVVIAAFAAAPGRQRPEFDSGSGEEGPAFRAIAAKADKLAAGKGADRLGEIERGPGHVLRVVACIAVEQHCAEAGCAENRSSLRSPSKRIKAVTHGVRPRLRGASGRQQDDGDCAGGLGGSRSPGGGATCRTPSEPWTRAGEPVGETLVRGSARSEPELLVKYLFTSERLSIQVHPGDEGGARGGYPRGKDEGLGRAPGRPRRGQSGSGLRGPVSSADLRAAAVDGSIEELVDWRPTQAGDTYYSPAGTVHALGRGLVLIEVQQNVDLTYRLYDYGRPRELHLDDGIAVAKPEPYVAPFQPYDAAPGRQILGRRPGFRAGAMDGCGVRKAGHGPAGLDRTRHRRRPASMGKHWRPARSGLSRVPRKSRSSKDRTCWSPIRGVRFSRRCACIRAPHPSSPKLVPR
jgi:hypothetical protein